MRLCDSGSSAVNRTLFSSRMPIRVHAARANLLQELGIVLPLGRRPADAAEALHHRQQNDDDDDKYENVFGQIIHN
jgi:hypothetical protein